MSDSKPPSYLFRPIVIAESENDLPFLRELYASTRRDEMKPSGWPKQEIEDFLRQQFEAQHTFYMEQFAGADFDVIVGENGAPIGRLYLDERDDEFRVIDIALLPEFRGHGIGGKIMQEVIDRAFAADKAVRIHVEHNNPAMHLYKRLGFEMVEEQGVYHLMEIKPPGKNKESAA